MNFIFDLDGTICFDGMTIPEKIYYALQKANIYGHQIIFASARSYRDCLPVIGDYFSGYPVIGLNGALIYHRGELKTADVINYSLYLELIRYCKERNIPYFVDDIIDYHSFLGDKISFISRVNIQGIAEEREFHEIDRPVKVVINLENHLSCKEELLQKMAKQPVEILFHEIENYLYINPENSTKATGIRSFIMGDYICFGNDKNDITMFQNAYYAVQIGDYPELTPYADEQIKGQDLEGQIADKMIELFKQYMHE
ncbi:HAD family phosphatase [Clostridiales bacterium COT073_COT-073]|nr:HAD family phosphatase [Clostridiales bacterium COT073_COT-073]